MARRELELGSTTRMHVKGTVPVLGQTLEVVSVEYRVKYDDAGEDIGEDVFVRVKAVGYAS